MKESVLIVADLTPTSDEQCYKLESELEKFGMLILTVDGYGNDAVSIVGEVEDADSVIRKVRRLLFDAGCKVIDISKQAVNQPTAPADQQSRLDESSPSNTQTDEPTVPESP